MAKFGPAKSLSEYTQNGNKVSPPFILLLLSLG
ncbi:hypothetical protein COLO4_02935 [Corchorus olitorius]|uniref:Uncharacterized protein n=1 Tax=Corchorus olitorius TaxID=93759 RepID=A0A1R3KZV8_9ROSI|nr:hypothetical protein COLO4_02935 [Corchorus olitorius]